MKLAWALAALMFVILAVAGGHAAMWYWLRGTFDHKQAAIIIGGGDLLLGLICAAAATGSVSDRAIEWI